MTREEGLKQIDEAQWMRDNYDTLHLYVTSPRDRPVDVWLSMRPVYCDRGHIQLNIDGPLQLDGADSFPRYFFSFAEADAHTRMFLKWRLWEYRTVSYAEISSRFKGEGDATF
jgi:hypothetical protein